MRRVGATYNLSNKSSTLFIKPVDSAKLSVNWMGSEEKWKLTLLKVSFQQRHL